MRLQSRQIGGLQKGRGGLSVRDPIFVAGFLRCDDIIQNDFLESKKKVGKGQNLEQAVWINHEWLAGRAITNLYSCPSGQESKTAWEKMNGDRRG
jgi:hypothetical protein